MNKFPIIDLKEITLREITNYDTQAFYKYINHPQVSKFIAQEDLPQDLAAASIELKYWADLFINNQSIYWAIARSTDNQIIGTCGFNMINHIHQRAEISYDLDYNEWNKGIMTKAMSAVCSFGFKQLNLKRIQAMTAINNLASIKVLTKLNFKQEGLLKRYGILDNQHQDFKLYSLLSN